MPMIKTFGVDAVAFDSGVDDDGQVRAGLWDRFTSWGEKIKDGRRSDFNELSLGQMGDNWRARGDRLSMCFNHQSAYVQQNGQPAPALAYYDALVVVKDGQVIASWSLDGSGASSAPFEPAARGDGLYGYRCEITPLGQDPREGLRNFKYISPMFTDDGRDEQGREVGYVLFDVAATNTPFQAGCEITFEGATGAEGERNMPKLSKLSKFVKFEEGADDKAIRQAVLSKMSAEATKCAADEGYNYAGAADEFEEMAKAYEDSQYDDEDKDAEAPHATMRKMAKQFRRMAKMGAEGGEGGEKKDPPAQMEGGEGKAEEKAKEQMSALAGRLGIKLPGGATSAQMFDAIKAGSLPTTELASIVASQVKRELGEAEQKRLAVETAGKAKQLMSVLRDDMPKDTKESLQRLAADPKTFEMATALAQPWLRADITVPVSQLFERFTSGGNPIGAPAPRDNATPRQERKIYENQLATFVVDDEAIAKLIRDAADAKDGPMKMEIDAMLDDAVRDLPDQRWMAADRLIRTKKHPELWEQTRRAGLQLF